MIEFGKTLKSAREAKGYTVPQLAEMTRLKSQVVEGLEKEDFSMIAAPIYGRGFVKLYCEAVGIDDPKPLVEEFMAILNGDREVSIKERPLAEPSVGVEETPVPAAPAVPPPVAPASEPDLFSQESPAATAATAAPVAPPPTEPEQSFARFAAPIRERPAEDAFPFCNPRIILLAVGALLVLALLVLGLRGLYRAMSSDTAPAEEPAPAPAAAEQAPAAKSAPRTQQKIPSLYID